MVLLSTAAPRPTSTETIRKRPARAGFTSSLIAGTALAAALLAPAGVANAQSAVRTVAHSASLAAGQGGDSGTCLDAGEGQTACLFKKQESKASATGSTESAETTQGGTGSSGGGFDLLDWILQMTSKIAPAVGQVASAVGSVGTAVSAWAPSTAAGQAVGSAVKAVTGS